MTAQVAKCRAAYAQLYNIGKIRKYLEQNSTDKLIHALVHSQIDYCNACLIGLPKYLIRKLQMVLNTAARILRRIRKYDHINKTCRQLHWLPVEFRNYKICFLNFKALHGQWPLYPLYLLKMASLSFLSILDKPLSQTVTYGDRRFAVAAANCWNPLPNEVKNAESLASFRRQLKTQLFKQAFLI